MFMKIQVRFGPKGELMISVMLWRIVDYMILHLRDMSLRGTINVLGMRMLSRGLNGALGTLI